ncbi:hypothetical protein ACU3L3_12145 [Priestia endophytica]|uniref:hypothetical protein n=1 Tax=Priestia endophytica TaxID=135735 RepID=UPI000A763CE2|nr:hypothetical protein [Priestia endophytica]
MNTNERALQLLEQNRYEESLDQFQKAVQQKRTVQSLTNLAWMYCNEMEEDEKSVSFITRSHQPKPDFSFSVPIARRNVLKRRKMATCRKDVN